jgi:peptidyl-prolyl cis-trans isomerase C
MKYFRIAAVLAVAGVLSLACSKNKETTVHAFPDSVLSDEVVATVNNDPILGSDIKVLAYTTTNASPDSLRNEAFNLRLLDQMIDRIIFAQEARAAGVTVADTMVVNMLDQFVMQFGGEERVGSMLAEMGLSKEDVARAFHRDMVIRDYVTKTVEPSIVVEEVDSRAFYDQNQTAFVAVDSVRASHIILLFRPEDTPDIRAERRAQMVDIQKQLKAGAKFADLAGQYSQDGAAQSGGDLGYFSREMMVAPFSDAAFALKKGQTSEIIETQFGFHLILCTDKKPAHTVTYQDARPRVDAMLRQQALGVELQDRLKKNRDAAIIVRNYEVEA